MPKGSLDLKSVFGRVGFSQFGEKGDVNCSGLWWVVERTEQNLDLDIFTTSGLTDSASISGRIQT